MSDKAYNMDQFSQLRRFGVPGTTVPQYTSYPPASRFANDVSPRDYLRWLSQIAAGSEISIYLHVPFCQRLCWFCSARTQGAPGGAPVTAYVDALIQEIHMVRAALPDGVQARRIYWGGGSPTILPPSDIKRLAAALFDAFPRSDSSELLVEIDPNEIDAARMDALAEIGMTHASIGVQDFDPEVQQIIGRELSFETTKATVDDLRARGLPSLSMSLLYGLPKQSRARLAMSTQMVLSLAPDLVAVHPYAHVPAIARRQSLIPTSDLPTPEGQLDLFNVARQVLKWDGFKPVGIDHFALTGNALANASKEGRLRRSFQGYTDDAAGVTLGFGASAISRLPQGYAQNAASTAAYLKAAQAGAAATARGHTFQGEDALRARMIEMILCDFRIETARLVTEGFGPASLIGSVLERFLADCGGQIVKTDTGISVLNEARTLARVIAQKLDNYTP